MKGDFAATVKLKSKYMGTCEHSRQTNMYVCVVLHSAGKVSQKAGQQRTVTCDVWRYFTNAKPSAMVHQRVQQDMAKHYKRLIPTLERIEIESDGSTSQFKGRFNFWVLGGGMFSEEDYAGLKLTGRHTAPGHGGGCADVCGKVAAAYLASMPNFDKVSAYNYSTAYDLCSAGLKKPSRPAEQIKGTWGCNGKFFWGVMTNGFDKVGRDKNHPTVPKFEAEDVSGIKDSRHLYAFRQVILCLLNSLLSLHSSSLGGSQKSSHVRDEATSLVMEARFIDCCCVFCRNEKEGECPYTEHFGKWFDVPLRLKGNIGASASEKKDYSLRDKKNIPCCGCKRKGNLRSLVTPAADLPPHPHRP
jgi:hypothetical protein